MMVDSSGGCWSQQFQRQLEQREEKQCGMGCSWVEDPSAVAFQSFAPAAGEAVGFSSLQESNLSSSQPLELAANGRKAASGGMAGRQAGRQNAEALTEGPFTKRQKRMIMEAPHGAPGGGEGKFPGQAGVLKHG